MNDKSESAAREFVFLLVDRFSLIAFSAALEPLRLANRVSRREVYSWKLVSDGGEPVRELFDEPTIDLVEDDRTLALSTVGIADEVDAGLAALWD